MNLGEHVCVDVCVCVCVCVLCVVWGCVLVRYSRTDVTYDLLWNN